MTYGLVAIVRNERDRIGALLDSVAPIVEAATIVDTGSTDGTQDVVRGFGWAVHERPWVDFGTNRSEAFALAQGSAEWLLALDADMTVEVDPTFVPAQGVDAYEVDMGSGGFSWRLPLVLRGDSPWISVGACHEYTCLADRTLGRRLPTDAIRIHHPGANASAEKLEWHASLLRAELERDPSSARSTYYLAQTLRDLGRRAEARELYARRATMGDFEEERWHALYQAAMLTEPWTDRLAALLAAWEARPARLEPVWHAAALMREHSMEQAARAILPRGRAVPADVLFVERWIWEAAA